MKMCQKRMMMDVIEYIIENQEKIYSFSRYSIDKNNKILNMDEAQNKSIGTKCEIIFKDKIWKK